MADETATRSNPRKVREGTVLSASMDKTAVISVVDRVRHPLYRKTLQRTKKLFSYIQFKQFQLTCVLVF